MTEVGDRTSAPHPKTDIASKKVFPTISGRASIYPALSFGEQKAVAARLLGAAMIGRATHIQRSTTCKSRRS
jgi:hypothetical protein